MEVFWKFKTKKKVSTQIRKFCSLFSSITLVWCIRNSCYKDVRSIRKTTSKVCTVWGKQFVRNATSCGKTKSFWTIITHTSVLVREILAKNKSLIRPLPLYSSELVAADFLLLPKPRISMKRKHFATLKDKKEKN